MCVLQISVDGDTSTNDTVIGLASGAAGNAKITDLTSPEAKQLEDAVTALLQVGPAHLLGFSAQHCVPIDGSASQAYCHGVGSLGCFGNMPSPHYVLRCLPLSIARIACHQGSVKVCVCSAGPGKVNSMGRRGRDLLDRGADIRGCQRRGCQEDFKVCCGVVPREGRCVWP